MNYDNILFEKKEGVATLTFNRPDKMNALSPYLLLEAADAITDARKDDAVKVLVVTGAGRAFCSGADLSFPAEERAKFQETVSRRTKTIPYGSFGEVSRALREFPKPVIAAVNGPATGAGFAFSLACDIRFASENARFSAIFVRRGLLPDSGITYYLPRIVGTAKALELFWTGDMIDAREAERIGIVGRVLHPEELMPAVYEFAGRLTKGPTLSIELAKEITYKAMQVDLATALEAEGWGAGVCAAADDVKEGFRAFLEKREPVFQGR